MIAFDSIPPIPRVVSTGALAVVLAGGLAITGCDDSNPPAGEVGTAGSDAPPSKKVVAGIDAAVLRRALSSSPLPPPPVDPTNRFADDPSAAELGRILFFETRVSGSGDVSCATCHQPDRWFTDGLEKSRGVDTAARHAPTLIDAAHHRWFNWDGRSDSMWGHTIRPIENPLEMGGDRTRLVRLVLQDDELRAGYEATFGAISLSLGELPPVASPSGGPPSVEAWERLSPVLQDRINRVTANIGKSLAAFQRTLRGGVSPFDRWAEAVSAGGDGGEILSDSERRGLVLFFGRAECWECHSGPLFSDGEFHNIGIPVPDGLPRDPGRYDGALLVKNDPFNAAGPYSDDVEGRQAILSRGVKRDPESWGAFRTPTLRGVGRTAPYMHDGSIPDLASVLRFYSTLEGAIQLEHHQESVLSPLDLDAREIEDLEAFLGTLTGPGPRVEPPAGERETGTSEE
ncbi:MAG: cytochrome c peroxidase [Phycisphaerales bacterium]|jgi:cytochrome c peroxidase|nr:cytochrome c peroxidase [Phycisphaerales bacterium]